MRVKFVRVRQWLKRMNVQGQRIRLLFARPEKVVMGIGQGKAHWNEPSPVCQVVGTLVKRGVAHQVHN